jgi:hypothetical protein
VTLSCCVPRLRSQVVDAADRCLVALGLPVPGIIWRCLRIRNNAYSLPLSHSGIRHYLSKVFTLLSWTLKRRIPSKRRHALSAALRLIILQFLEVEVKLRQNVSLRVYLDVWLQSRTHDQFLSCLDNCGFLAAGYPLWREDGSVIYSYICLPEQPLSDPSPSKVTNIFYCPLYCLRIYIPPPEQSGPVMPLDIEFPFHRLLWHKATVEVF